MKNKRNIGFLAPGIVFFILFISTLQPVWLILTVVFCIIYFTTKV
jgi:hypothetical protein